MKMDSNHLKIDSKFNNLKFQIKNDSNFNFFNLFMLSILAAGHVIIALSIFNSIRSNGTLAYKVAFVIFGLFGLFSINKQLRTILISTKGIEEIEIDNNSVHYRGKYGIFTKTLSLNLDKIKKIELSPIGTDKFSQSFQMITQMKYGIIVLKKSRSKEIAFGESLNKRELETLFAEIEKKIKPNTIVIKP